MLGLLGGCAGTRSAPSPPADMLTVALAALPPAEQGPFNIAGLTGLPIWPALYDTLTEMHDDGQVHPGLATSWEQSAPTRWRFTLRQGLRFADGSPLDAHAVAATLAYLASPEGRGTQSARALAHVAQARALDAVTVEIATKTPDAALDRALSTLFIVAPGSWSRAGASGAAALPIGSGPFTATDWDLAQARLVPNPHAWRPPQVARLSVHAVPETTARTQTIQTGAADIAVGLGPEQQAVLEATGARLRVEPGSGVLALAFVTQRSGNPLRDRRVRQALGLAIDRAALVATLLPGQTQPARGFAPPLALGSDPAAPALPYDPVRARALLAEAGHAKGLRLAVEAAIGLAAADAPILQQIAADLAAIGVTLEVKRATGEALARHIEQGGWETDAFMIDYGAGPGMDALTGLERHSCLWPQPWTCDRAAAALIEAARRAPTLPERQRLTAEALRQALAEMPGLPLIDLAGFYGVAERVRGLDPNYGRINWQDISLAQ